MSYFSVYLDYLYPKGGTGKITKLLEGFVREKGSEIETGTCIVQVDPEKRSVVTDKGNTYQYKDLIWCADLNGLYRAIDSQRITKPRTERAVLQQAELYRSHEGAIRYSPSSFRWIGRPNILNRSRRDTFSTPPTEGGSVISTQKNSTGCSENTAHIERINNT